ncbi:hypothetical protein GYMLUDRAFT_240976 [Collybiopsis luxurians FD-317 M1]|nr:hypothetical protein GYMLUDRAFT_240976 [Collybiopsis luxurians FD-317 M1]
MAGDVGQYGVETGHGCAAIGSIRLAGGVFNEEEGPYEVGEGECRAGCIGGYSRYIGRLQNKWEPLYIGTITSVPTEELSRLSRDTKPMDDWSANETAAGTIVEDGKKNSQELLADIVEWLIGAAYVHRALSFRFKSAQFFHLNIESWPLTSLFQLPVSDPTFQRGKAHLVHLLSSTIVRRSIDASVKRTTDDLPLRPPNEHAAQGRWTPSRNPSSGKLQPTDANEGNGYSHRHTLYRLNNESSVHQYPHSAFIFPSSPVSP